MVVASDEEARGFVFAYDKLFATKAKSKADLENERRREGDHHRPDAATVLCDLQPRGAKSLAVVYYTAADPTLARDAMIRQECRSSPARCRLIV